MNDPNIARTRVSVVEKAKKEGVPKDDAWYVIQQDWNHTFEGHMLEATIDRVYDEGN